MSWQRSQLKFYTRLCAESASSGSVGADLEPNLFAGPAENHHKSIASNILYLVTQSINDASSPEFFSIRAPAQVVLASQASKEPRVVNNGQTVKVDIPTEYLSFQNNLVSSKVALRAPVTPQLRRFVLPVSE